MNRSLVIFLKMILTITILYTPYLVCSFYLISTLKNSILKNFNDNEDTTIINNSDRKSHISFSFSFSELFINILCYFIVLAPFLFLKQVSKKRQFYTSAKYSYNSFMRFCFFNYYESIHPTESLPIINSSSRLQPSNQEHSNLVLIFFAIGLQISYLTWGVTQERIMTMPYRSGEYFKDSQFLVFVNRLVAFCVTLLVYFIRSVLKSSKADFQLKDKSFKNVPFFFFSYASLSNIISSWCQYEALKFVSFPTQVLSKACKVIPVMVIGKCVQNKIYTGYEYFTATMISVGMALFLLFNGHLETSNPAENFDAINFVGSLFLVLYMVFDSFTSNWQDFLFKRYGISSFYMLIGINFWSIVLTIGPLLEQNSFSKSYQFATDNSLFVFDMLISSICGALGQLLIYGTIKRYGAVTFTIIMTVRQALSVIISCILFNHKLRPLAILGLIIIFSGLFLRVSWRKKSKSVS